MLTLQAEEDREWAGFESLRCILASERLGFMNRSYYTPWASPFDDLRRIAIIAGLATHARKQLADTVASELDEEVRWSRARAVADDLERLAAALAGIAAESKARAQDIYAVQNEVLAGARGGDLNP